MNTNKYISIGAAAVIITIMSGLVYVTVQQSYRSGLNDPQIQVAEDVTIVLAAGNKKPQDIVAPSQVDVSPTLSPFIIMYDEQGKPVVASGQYKGQTPTPPSGTFDYARQHGEDRFSWQLDPGVREATVLRRYVTKDSSGFVLVARSMREVEAREHNLIFLVLIGWLASLLVLAVAAVLLRRHSRRHEPEPIAS